MVSESTPNAATSTRILPAACTASQWMATPAVRHSRATSATGCSVPISFDASIRQTNRVSGRSAAPILPPSIAPDGSGATTVTAMPSA